MNQFLRYVSAAWMMMSICTGTVEARAEKAEANDFVRMSVKKLCRVRRAANQNTAVIAKIREGAVVEVRLKKKAADCPKGWFERADGGFVCGKHLIPSDADREKTAPEDAPDLRRGFFAVEVTAKKTSLYKKEKSLSGRRPDGVLLKGSVLTAAGEQDNRGETFYRTRKGWFVAEKDCERLPAGISTLAKDVSSDTQTPGALVVGKNARIYQSPNVEAAQIGTLARWSYIPRHDFAALIREGEFVKLPNGGYARDEDLARFRPAAMPKHLKADERWIAVDLQEQLLTAYEGDKPIRIMPCSTGVRRNTFKGHYTISRKLKQQTMRLRMCRIRVEDVQWVMYYDEEESLAVHSAYWHDDFGTPVSHGCVNLPTDDAAWLFDWASPKSSVTDTVTYPLPRDSGTAVIVF